eukprot:39407_1
MNAPKPMWKQNTQMEYNNKPLPQRYNQQPLPPPPPPPPSGPPPVMQKHINHMKQYPVKVKPLPNQSQFKNKPLPPNNYAYNKHLPYNNKLQKHKIPINKQLPKQPIKQSNVNPYNTQQISNSNYINNNQLPYTNNNYNTQNNNNTMHQPYIENNKQFSRYNSAPVNNKKYMNQTANHSRTNQSLPTHNNSRINQSFSPNNKSHIQNNKTFFQSSNQNNNQTTPQNNKYNRNHQNNNSKTSNKHNQNDHTVSSHNNINNKRIQNKNTFINQHPNDHKLPSISNNKFIQNNNVSKVNKINTQNNNKKFFPKPLNQNNNNYKNENINNQPLNKNNESFPISPPEHKQKYNNKKAYNMVAKNALPLASIPSEIPVDTNVSHRKYKTEKIQTYNTKHNDKVFRDVNDYKKDTHQISKSEPNKPVIITPQLPKVQSQSTFSDITIPPIPDDNRQAIDNNSNKATDLINYFNNTNINKKSNILLPSDNPNAPTYFKHQLNEQKSDEIQPNINKKVTFLANEISKMEESEASISNISDNISEYKDNISINEDITSNVSTEIPENKEINSPNICIRIDCDASEVSLKMAQENHQELMAMTQTTKSQSQITDMTHYTDINITPSAISIGIDTNTVDSIDTYDITKQQINDNDNNGDIETQSHPQHMSIDYKQAAKNFGADDLFNTPTEITESNNDFETPIPIDNNNNNNYNKNNTFILHNIGKSSLNIDEEY